MTQNGGIPAQFQGDREGQKPTTTKSDGMWTIRGGGIKRVPQPLLMLPLVFATQPDGVRSGRIIVVVLIYYYYKRSHILCSRSGYPLDERRYDPCCDPIDYLVLAHADRCLWHFVGFQRGVRPRLNCLRLLANLPPLPHKMSCHLPVPAI